jgi:hypothetical protein
VQPADGQSVLPLPSPNPAQPPLVQPFTDALALSDPNTALLQQIRERVIRLGFVPPLLVLVVGLLVSLGAGDNQRTELIFFGVLLGLLLALMGWRLWFYWPQHRRGYALFSRYRWQAVPAVLIANTPCLRRMNWYGKQALLRTGTLWICGPDEQGRALIRIAGSTAEAVADVTDAAPTGAPPVLVRPSSPRPADDPALIRLRRATNRTSLITAAILVLLDGLGVGALTNASYNDVSPVLTGWLCGATVALVFLARGWFVAQRGHRQSVAAAQWQPVQVSLDTWEAPTNVSVRNGSGRIILPNGWHGYVEFPRLRLDFAANLRATGVLWVAGDAVPGRTVPIGVPGFPLRGVVKIQA